jgi:hypothetical protein
VKLRHPFDVSRRRLLAGMVAATTAVNSSALANFWHLKGLGGGGAAPPLVGPDVAHYTGAPLSGGTPPTDPVRTTAKPAVQWWQPSENRMSGDMVIGVDADALGGVAYVDFWVEGTVQRVTQSLYVDTDVNGNTRKRLGFWITLNSAAFKAVSTTGSARIFATATPNDGTMQVRTIGNTLVAPSGLPGAANGDRKMIIYPRATASDFDKTVGVGGDYPTLDAWIAAAKAASAEAARATIITNGSYEFSTVTGALYTGAKGFHVVRAGSGISATVGRAVFPSGASSTWALDPLVECLEFRGSGITVDFRNFTVLGNGSYTRGHRFNGCNVTNSVGTRDTLYWNNGPRPQSGNPGLAPGYFEDCVITYISGLTTFQILTCGNKTHMVGEHLWSGTHFTANNYVHSYNSGFIRNVTAALTLAYSGAGTATIDKTGGSDTGTGNGGASGGALVLKVNGSAVKTYSLGQIASDTWYKISDIVADINANVAGWTATLIDDTRRASGIIGVTGASTNGFTGQAITSTPLTLNTWFDHHCDMTQMYTGGGTNIRENVLHRANIVVGISSDAATGGYANPGTNAFRYDSWLNDVVITDCAYGTPNMLGSSDFGGGRTYSHLLHRNMVHEGPTNLVASTCDAYCRYEQCVLGQIGWDTANGPTPLTFKDSYIANGFQNSGSGAAFVASPNSGNVTFNATTSTNFHLNTLVQDPIVGDFRPLALMPTKAKISDHDALDNLRIATDAIGTFSSTQVAAPSYPF